MKVRMTMILEFDPVMWGDLYEEKEWMKQIASKENTYVHNNEIGDQFGDIVEIECFEFIE